MVKFSTNVLITNVGCLFLFLLLPNIIVVLYIASSLVFVVLLAVLFCLILLLLVLPFSEFLVLFCFVLFFNFDDNSQRYFHKLFSVFLVLFCFVIFCYFFILFCCYFTTLHAFSACQAAKKPTNRLLPFFSF